LPSVEKFRLKPNYQTAQAVAVGMKNWKKSVSLKHVDWWLLLTSEAVAVGSKIWIQNLIELPRPLPSIRKIGLKPVH